MELEHLPEIPGARLAGHGHRLQADRLPFLLDAERAGPVSRMRLMHKSILFVNSPESVHELLVERAKSFEKSPGMRILFHDLLGDGLVTSEHEVWQRQRRLMSPLFRAAPLAEYAKTMNLVTRKAVLRLRDGQVIDLAREVNLIAMSVVGSTLFGAENFDAADEIGRAITFAMRWIDKHIASSALIMQVSVTDALHLMKPEIPDLFREVHAKVEDVLRDPVLVPGRLDPAFGAAVRTLDNAVQKIIEDRRAAPDARADLLTMLLLARDPIDGGMQGLSDAEVRDQTMTLFIAGHETTATAIAWCFYLLARHPDVRARVQAEADAFGPEGPTTWEPSRLAYTTRVFKETMRLFPPVVMVPRRSIEPFILGGAEYPKHTFAMANIYGVHHSPSVWDSPLSFDPDRFLPENEAKRHKSAWLPFGLGPRVCIGNGFSLMEGPIVLATLMRNFRFDIDAGRDAVPDATFMLRPKGGIPAVVRQIH